MNQKGNKSERNQAMERGLQEELVENGILIPCPQLTQQVVSIGTSPMALGYGSQKEQMVVCLCFW